MFTDGPRAARMQDRLIAHVARVACAMLAALNASAVPAAAQDEALVYGTRIRIETLDEKRPHEGTFRQLTADSIIFSPGLDTLTQAIPLGRVRRIDVSRPNGGRSVLKGAAIGAGVGLGALIAAGGVCHASNADCALGLVLIGPAVVTVGALAGGLIGSQDDGEHWSRVYRQERRASLLIGPSSHHGLIVGGNIPFGSAPSN